MSEGEVLESAEGVVDADVGVGEYEEGDESGAPFDMGNLTDAPDEAPVLPVSDYTMTFAGAKHKVVEKETDGGETVRQGIITLQFSSPEFPEGFGNYFHDIRGDVKGLKPIPLFVKTINKKLLAALGLPLNLSFPNEEAFVEAFEVSKGRKVKVYVKHSKSGGNTYANISKVMPSEAPSS